MMLRSIRRCLLKGSLLKINLKPIMASKGRLPPQDFRHPPSGSSVGHHDPYHDPYGAAVHLPPGGFPHFDMLPPPEVMEQKLSAQHAEISKLVKENQRLAATHGTLRQDLATASNELRVINGHIAEMESEKEQQTRGIMEKMAMMEAELKAAEAIKKDLQKAHAEAQSLVAARQDLISKVQQLNRDLQMAHSDAQQIPALMADLDGLRQECQHARATFDYEKKLYNDHLESLQVMEKNYMGMSREVDKLRSELANLSNLDPRTGGPYSSYPGYGEGYPMGNYAPAQNAYPGPQGQAPHLGGGPAGRAAGTGTGVSAVTGGNSPHVTGVAHSAPPGPGAPPDASKLPGYPATSGSGYGGHVGTGYDSQKGRPGASYDAQRVPNYDSQRGFTGPGYDPQRGPMGPGYDPHRGHMGAGFGANAGLGGGGYDPQGKSGYTGQGAPGYDMQRGPVNDAQRGGPHDVQKGGRYEHTTANRGSAGTQGQNSAKNTNYGIGAGYEQRGGNPASR